MTRNSTENPPSGSCTCSKSHGRITEKRMYSSTDSTFCPVKLLKPLTEKQKRVHVLFLTVLEYSIPQMNMWNKWYSAKPLSKRTFSHMQSCGCRNSFFHLFHFKKQCPNSPRCKVYKEEGHTTGDPACTEPAANVTPFSGEKNYPSNFFTCDITIFGHNHISAEHAYQYVKAMRSRDVPRASAI